MHNQFTRSPFARPGTQTDPEIATRIGTQEQALQIIEQLRDLDANIARALAVITPTFAVVEPAALTGPDATTASFTLPAGRWVLNQAAYSIDGFTGITVVDSRLKIGNGVNVWWSNYACPAAGLVQVNISEFAKGGLYLATPSVEFNFISDYCPLVFDSASAVTLRIDQTNGGAEVVTINNMRFVFRRIGDSAGV